MPRLAPQVQVIVQLQKEVPKDWAECKDKFLVQRACVKCAFCSVRFKEDAQRALEALFEGGRAAGVSEAKLAVQVKVATAVSPAAAPAAAAAAAAAAAKARSDADLAAAARVAAAKEVQARATAAEAAATAANQAAAARAAQEETARTQAAAAAAAATTAAAKARADANAAAAARVVAAERAAQEAQARATAAEAQALAAAAAQAAQADAARKHAAAVPADVASLLADLSLSAFGPALCSELGMSSVADAAFITDADLQKLGMKPLECRKFLAAALQHAGGASAAAAPAAALQPTSSAGSAFCDVMISYRVPETGEGGDKSVFYFQSALEKRGYSVFVGEAAIQGGASWPTTIQQGVETCQAFVILCSPTYGDPVVSPWTKRELELADNLKKPLIPVFHSGTYPPPTVSIYLGGLQRIPGGNFREGYVAAKISHDKVVEELAAALARAGVLPGRARAGA
jgi:hypothetical protein